MNSAVDVIAGVLLVFGAGLILLAGVGVWRFDDIYARMHAAAKAPTLGILAIALGVALSVQTVVATVTSLLVVVLQLVTGPVGTHLLGRSAYRRLPNDFDAGDELAADEAGDVDH